MQRKKRYIFKDKGFEHLFVLDDGDERSLRFTVADGESQSTISLSNPEAVPAEYIRVAMLGMLMTRRSERVLMVGLGGGSFTSLLRRHYPNLWIEVTEVDPAVVKVAKRFFGVEEDDRFRIHVADGARFVAETGATYDLAFLDPYTGKEIPQDLTGSCFFDAVKARLSNSGVAVLNLWNRGPREGSIVDAFQSSFSHTASIRTENGHNLVVFGKVAEMPDPGELTAAAYRLTEKRGLSFDLGRISEKLILSVAR